MRLFQKVLQLPDWSYSMKTAGEKVGLSSSSPSKEVGRQAESPTIHLFTYTPFALWLTIF